jgi:hypothetical protein
MYPTASTTNSVCILIFFRYCSHYGVVVALAVRISFGRIAKASKHTFPSIQVQKPAMAVSLWVIPSLRIRRAMCRAAVFAACATRRS